jgi:transposase-like protein
MGTTLSLSLLVSLSTAIRERAIEALLSEATVSQAAVKCGVSERTLRRWMDTDREFRHGLAEAQRDAFEAATQRVQGLSVTAFDTLAELMGPGAPAHVRLEAARIVAELATRQAETDTLRQRPDQLVARPENEDTPGVVMRAPSATDVPAAATPDADWALDESPVAALLRPWRLGGVRQ